MGWNEIINNLHVIFHRCKTLIVCPLLIIHYMIFVHLYQANKCWTMPMQWYGLNALNTAHNTFIKFNRPFYAYSKMRLWARVGIDINNNFHCRLISCAFDKLNNSVYCANAVMRIIISNLFHQFVNTFWMMKVHRRRMQ